ncbi:MAG: SWIM zinc finger family protein [Chloroflexi bacterium]|nr:SWIM zinc finger family protein [Chloroflexota bacterium]
MSRRYDYWDHFEPSRPKPTTEGVKAKSQRGAIGETWWSTRFIKLLESFGMGPRLGRGRSYARSGQVLPLSIEAGLVKTKVQGSRSTPYAVEIRLAPLTDGNWEKVFERMSEQAVFMAKLLAGEMPANIEEAFAAAQVSLLPQTVKDLVTECSCPDWANPCKHVAAVFYILAEAFDGDPFLIFALRGRTKEQVIDKLRGMRSPSIEGRRAVTETESENLAAPVGEQLGPPPLAECLASFWTAGGQLSQIQANPVPAEVPDALIRQLGPLPPHLRSEELLQQLSHAYAELVRRSTDAGE